MTKYLAKLCNLQTRAKWPWFKGSALLLGAAAVLGLTACAQSAPYRTELNQPYQETTSQGVQPDCNSKFAKMTPEIPKGRPYELYFVEFDDQGWLHPGRAETAHNGDADKQIDFLMERLKKEMEKDTSKISIILYIHGWKHNADCEDDNVKKFRQVLTSISSVEQEQNGQKREIIGIYVGWRGKALKLPLEDFTFWDRKAAALRVAQGSARELLARLRAFQNYYNEKDDQCKADSDPSKRPDCRIRMLLIGHSFGGWILYSATSGWLIQTSAAKVDVDGKQAVGGKDATANAGYNANERLADLVVLLNPAFEGSRYQPLHKVAQCQRTTDTTNQATDGNRPCPSQLRPYDHYESPFLVTITSSADWATGSAFPIGRWINSILERPTASDEQSEAITHTPGHIDRYITHSLKKVDSEPEKCQGYNPQDLTLIKETYDKEEANEEEFFARYKDDSKGVYRLPPGWERRFCGGAVLTHREGQSDPNSPVWNVQADESIINGHNDIEGDALVAFIRQLYHELVKKSSPENSGSAATAMTGSVSPRRPD
ncbi:MAG: hypothetical protein U1F76_11150 [Candidatus Competibacteraceae bacterium]